MTSERASMGSIVGMADVMVSSGTAIRDVTYKPSGICGGGKSSRIVVISSRFDALYALCSRLTSATFGAVCSRQRSSRLGRGADRGSMGCLGTTLSQGVGQRRRERLAKCTTASNC